MTRDETKKILMNIQCSYANWKPTGDLGFMVDIWQDDLSDYTYEEVYMALKAYKTSNSSGFAPTVGQLVEQMYVLKSGEEINELTAWDMVRKALGNSNYHSEEEFNNLPALVQKAVGSASQLQAWASDPDYNESVMSSNFMRTYRTVSERSKKDAMISPSIKNLIAQSQNKMIGVNDE